MGYIAGIGGANMDIHGRSDRQLIMRDSNPGSLHTSLGGVCRNICENLARLGENVRLITVVGDDVQGRGIVEGCEKAGIDMSAARVLRGERSSSYISIMDGDGDMLLAMSDMHIIKQLNAKLVDESRDLLCGADLVVCDGNLSAQTIERLAQVCDRPLYLDPVSTAWARELKPFIGCFDTVKPNRMELEVLSGCPVDTKENIVLACDILRGKGVPVTVNRLASMYTVFFSDGPLRNFEDVKNSDTEMYSRFFRAMRERNIFVAPSAFEVAMVSFAHTEEDFAKTLDAVRGIKL